MKGAAEHEIARRAAAVVEAGRIAMRFFRQEHERWEKGPGQVVTEADLAIDRFLQAMRCAAGAADGWLSEETEDDRSRLTSRRVWVVDPIDGTALLRRRHARVHRLRGAGGRRPRRSWASSSTRPPSEMFEAARAEGASQRRTDALASAVAASTRRRSWPAGSRAAGAASRR